MEFLKKNAGLIITVIAIGFVVWYFFLRKKKSTESGYWTDAKCKRMGCTGLGSDGRCTGCRFRGTTTTAAGDSSYAISGVKRCCCEQPDPNGFCTGNVSSRCCAGGTIGYLNTSKGSTLA